ncbi:hypothetical protein K488DRAFT_77385 [Vararia minispora EC-137]|uniref:Uncharacterized protein n=1 Tax=Vararia minispora EC-137 TaxID=1314806 RepID=A0ACB8QRQ5_9AGAM|nr:hypothetical protein K488DRAFT_77385 [Vararia minispora EC-137]
MLKASLVHVQTVRASVGSSIEVFTFRRPGPPASETAQPKQAAITAPQRTTTATSRRTTQTARPQPYPADKLTRGRAPRRRVGRSDVSSPVSSDRTLSPQAQTRVAVEPSITAALRSELEATRSELSRSQLESTRYSDRCRYLERTLRDTTEQLLGREREVEELKRERARLIADRERERERERERIRLSRANPLPLPPVPVEENLSEPGLEVFLTKTDRWSGAQVIEAVQDLNSEILQLAAAVTEVTTVAPQPVAPQPRVQHARKAVSNRLGHAFAQVLSTRNHTHDPTLVQFALQTCITTCTARMLSGFCIGLPVMPNELFAQLYDDVREVADGFSLPSEPQATSSRWRALTLAHIRNLNPQLEEMAVNEFVNVILRAWADIFVLCSCTSADIALASLDALRARFGQQTARIAASACKLARVVKEDIMSTNFELLFVEQGAPFVPDEMTNAYAGFGAARGAVLCTTELGLQCLTRKRVKRDCEEDETTARTLLLPKVILESVAQVLDNMSSQ